MEKLTKEVTDIMSEILENEEFIKVIEEQHKKYKRDLVIYAIVIGLFIFSLGFVIGYII